MGQFVPDKLTPLTADMAAAALSDGYRIVTGAKPTQAILSLLIGQSALETGNWHSIHNYNFGNVRGEAPNTGLYTSFRAGEIENGKEVFYEAGDPRNKFRAFATAAEGAADYIRSLRDRPHWWAGLMTGTPEGFVAGLTTYPAYFTANAALYTKTLHERANNYLALAQQYGGKTSIWAAFTVGVAAALGFTAVRRYRQA
jgi:flagellum-specific peptidoglycan hydrolase FlgJ